MFNVMATSRAEAILFLSISTQHLPMELPTPHLRIHRTSCTQTLFAIQNQCKIICHHVMACLLRQIEPGESLVHGLG